MDSIKRVERPTTVIYNDQIKRVDERESGFNRAFRGDFGERLSKEVQPVVTTRISRSLFIPMFPFT